MVSKNKNTYWWVIFVALFVVVLTGSFNVRDNGLVGDGRDSHGCLNSAGFSYDWEVEACTKHWEINTLELKDAAKTAKDYIYEEYHIGQEMTIVSVMPLGCDLCYEVEIERGDARWFLELKLGEVVQEIDR